MQSYLQGLNIQMKKFIVKAFIFLTPLIAIFLYIEIKLRTVPNSYEIKKKFIETNYSKIETVVLGSSQSLYGINPNYFSSTTVNLGNSSQSHYFDVALLQKYLDKLSNLKTVIIPTTYFSLYYNMNDGREKLRTYAYYYYFKIKNINFKYTDLQNYSLACLLGTKRVLMVALSGFKQLDEESMTNMTTNGFLALDSVNQNKRISESSGKQKVIEHSQLIKSQNLKFNIKQISNLLTKLNKRHINIIFTTTPTCVTYNEKIDERVVAKNTFIIDSLCKVYNALYYNYSTSERFTKADFFDNDHLNKYGAQKFSKILDSIITNKFH